MTSTPSVRATPADGRSKPAAMRSSELLPDPLGPEHDAALAALDRERHALQRDGARRAVRVDAEDVAQLECERLASLGPLLPGDAAPGSAAAVGDAQRAPRPARRRAARAAAAAPAIVSQGVMRWSGGSGTASVASTASRRPVATARPMPSATPASTPSSARPSARQRTQARSARGPAPCDSRSNRLSPSSRRKPERRERDAEQRERERGDRGGDERRDDAARDRIALQVAVDRGARGDVERGEGRLAQRRGDLRSMPPAVSRARARRGSTRAGRRRRAPRRATPRRRRTKLSPASWVVGKRLATATSRACTTWPPNDSSSAPPAPALAATSGLATTGRRRSSNGCRGRSTACCDVSIT